MSDFLSENWGSIVVALILCGIVAAVVRKLVKDRKRGSCSGCGCSCDKGSCGKK